MRIAMRMAHSVGLRQQSGAIGVEIFSEHEKFVPDWSAPTATLSWLLLNLQVFSFDTAQCLECLYCFDGVITQLIENTFEVFLVERYFVPLSVFDRAVGFTFISMSVHMRFSVGM